MSVVPGSAPYHAPSLYPVQVGAHVVAELIDRLADVDRAGAYVCAASLYAQVRLRTRSGTMREESQSGRHHESRGDSSHCITNGLDHVGRAHRVTSEKEPDIVVPEGGSRTTV